MQVLIIEDENLAAEKIKAQLKNISDQHEAVGVIRSVAKGIKWFEENDHPDLVLSDIQLLDGLSFEIFQQVKVNCPVIFTTAFDKYAIQAFDVNSIAYLLKPINEDKLREAIDKLGGSAEKPLISETDLDKLATLLQSRMAGAEKKKYKNRFLVRTYHNIIVIASMQFEFEATLKVWMDFTDGLSGYHVFSIESEKGFRVEQLFKFVQAVVYWKFLIGGGHQKGKFVFCKEI